MQQSSLHTARTLDAPVRIVLEQLLGRVLNDNEAISIRTYEPQEAPSAEQQRAVANDLRRYFAEADARVGSISEREQEEAVDEAMRSVRPGYRSTR